MKLKLTALIALVSLSGCATFEKWNVFDDEKETMTPVPLAVENENEMAMSADPEMPPAKSSVKFQASYRDQLLNKMGRLAQRKPNKATSAKNVNYYVRGLMQDLVGNMQYVNATTPLAVTSFVFLDSDYEQADLVGKQLSESFIHEVHKFGIPVLDFKTTDYVRVSPDGDFILSKDYLELTGELPIKYVVAGTLVKHLAGYMVNARIIGLQSKAVVASAQGFLPASVINSLISSKLNDGIAVTSGEE